MNDMYFHARKKQEPEEFEQHMVAREAERESQLDFHVVERVIDAQDGEDETEYYVKCKWPIIISAHPGCLIRKQGRA